MTEKSMSDLEQRIQNLEAELVAEKRRQKALGDRLNMLESVVNGVPMLLTCMDREEKYLFVNRAYAQWYGLNPEDLIGKRVSDMLKPDVYEWVSPYIKKVLDGQSVSYENKVIDKDGAERHISVSYEPHFRDTQVIGFYTAIADITERKQAAEALINLDQQLLLIINSFPGRVAQIDRDFHYRFINNQYEQVHGFRRDQVLGHTIAEVFGETVFRNVLPFVQRALNGETVSTETKIVNHKGETIYAYNTYIPDVALDGTIRGLIAVFVDITEIKRTEETLKRSEENFRRFLDDSPLGARIVSEAGDTIYANRALLDIYGYMDIAELQATPATDRYTPESYAAYLLRKTGRKKGELVPSEYEIDIVRKDGTVRHLQVFRKNIVWNGDPQFQVLYQDITERKKTEEERNSLRERLQRAEKLEVLGRMAGKVAHDLNNVLGSLSGYSELLLMQIPEGQPSRGNAAKIMESAKKGAAIIQDLITLARRGVTASEVVNLNRIITDFQKSPTFEKLKMDHARVTFKTECEHLLLNVKGSAVHLEKALVNLVSNAAEAIAGRGEVVIKTQNLYLDKTIRGYDDVRQGDYAVLTVADTGIGIRDEDREKIFEPFYTRKAMGKSGTGLGLSIVWGTVRDHNGYVDLQSGIGEGSTFTLYFPVTRQTLLEPRQKIPREQYAGKGESVLVVDDVNEQREVASGMLTALGYRVHTVSGGEKAVEYLKSHAADILVLDMIMAPGIDGLETYRRVLEVNPGQKAILVSGYSETERVRKAQRMGAGAYVKKPYLMENIGVAIRNELNR